MLFNQRIGLIEATEELKRVNVDTKTFTRPLFHDYTTNAGYANVSSNNANVFPLTTNYKAVSGAGDFPVYAYYGKQKFGIPEDPSSYSPCETTITIKDGNAVIYTFVLGLDDKGQQKYQDGTQVATTQVSIRQEITVEYSYTYEYPSGPQEMGNTVGPIQIVNNIKPKPNKTITEVINTVLNYACGNRNRYYVLDPVYAEKWQNIVAPEFYFTRNTLYEVLLQIGGYRDIQAIPRLEYLEASEGIGVASYTESKDTTLQLAFVGAPTYPEYVNVLQVKSAHWYYLIPYSTTITVTGYKTDGSSTVVASVAAADNNDDLSLNVQLSSEYSYYKVAYKYSGIDGTATHTYTVKYIESGLRLITFDDLNVESEWTPPGATTTDPYGNLITYHEEQSADDYFAGLDSYADNIIDNSVNGSIGLPSPYTPRCESGDLAVTDNTVIIETSMPIYSVQKVELFYKDTLVVRTKDITPYIFEKSEYDLLTDYQGEFPTAKQYAFYYSQGARNIYGLTLKPEVFDFLGISQEAQEPAAVKVYEAVSGKEFDAATQKVIDFMYRVTYTPIQTRRLKQYRPLVGERPDWDISYYNQSANTLDAKNLGDNMKFMLLQKGNRLKVVTYRLTGDTGSILEQIPKIGQTLNGAKICQVDAEYERYSVKVTLWLTEHYNRKSQYVEINAQKRFYEISERQSVLRQLNASYEYRIGKVDPDADKAIISADLVESFIKGTPPTTTNNRVAQAIVKMYTDDDGNGEQIGDALLLPVSAIGFGNSISLHFEMTDNYSAGDQVIYKDGNVNKVSLLRAVPCGDEYGEFISMTIGFLGGEIPWSSLSNEGWTEYRKVGRTLPEMDAGLNDDETPLFADVLNVAKDNREQISVDVQIHFRTDSSTIVIGSAFGERFPYVNAHIGTDDEELEWVELLKPIAPLQNRLEPDQYRTGESRNFAITTEQGDGFVKIAQITALDPDNNDEPWGEGVALIVKNTGELVFGKNVIPHKEVSGGSLVYGYFFGDNFCFPTKVKPL